MPGWKQWSQAALLGALALLVWSSPAPSETVTERAGSVDRDSEVSGDTDSLGADAVDSQAGTLSKTFNAPDPRTFRDFTEQEKQNQAPEAKIDLILSEGWSKDTVSESETAIGVELLTNDFENANQHPMLADGNLKGGSGGSGGNGSQENPHWGVKLIKYSIVSVEWVAVNSPLDSNPNGGGDSRIYPGKQNPTDTVDRTKVSAKATISPAVAGQVVYFRMFDVDDPSANTMPIDDETKGSDNRGSPSAGTLSATSALTNGNGEATVELTVTSRP